MARNKLYDLNNHLFEQLERLNDREMTAEQLEMESKRAKAMAGVASQILKTAELTIDAMKMVANGEFSKQDVSGFIKLD
jgi:hypothetical protein